MQTTDRRAFLKTMAAALGAASAPTILRAVTPESTRPNVLFVAVDDLRPMLSCFGDTVAVTPNLDRLASRGTLFDRAYCQQAVCNPSRQSLLTGRRPDSIKVWDLKTHFRTTSPDTVSLPQVFRDQGYFCQSFGKIYHGEEPMADPASWSVPEQFEYTPKRDDYILARNHVSRSAQKAAAMEFENAADDDYPDGKVARGAVAALRGFAQSKQQKPFFLGVGFRKPHLPFTAPRKYWELYDPAKIPSPQREEPPRGAPPIALHPSVELRGYLNMPQEGKFPSDLTQELRHGYYAGVSYTDAQIGRVLDTLDQTGLAKNTIVVFWVDHGFHLGEHGLWTKTTNYEADTRVPVIIAYPGQTTPGTKCHAIIELLDLFPTLCDLAGVKPPSQLEGRSLRPWLENPRLPSTKPAYSQFPRPWFYRGQPSTMGYAVRNETHRYIEWRDFGSKAVTARELYPLSEGQEFETDNLANDPAQADRVKSMSALLPS
jgi:iduronate 2-sulfatase